MTLNGPIRIKKVLVRFELRSYRDKLTLGIEESMLYRRDASFDGASLL